MRFLLVDKIVSLEAKKSISARKNLSLSEEYLQDHFPGFAVMPGVLMLETMVQASAWLMRYSEDFQYSTILLKQARAIKFNSFVKPGQTLAVTSTVHKWNDDDDCIFKTVGIVGDKLTVSARITLQRFNLADKHAELATTDEALTQEMRKIFNQIWSPATNVLEEGN
jgi:3-hydroxyacyl-[acyl-carrier-protein] dehydratase